jgi:hypothetical protein
MTGFVERWIEQGKQEGLEHGLEQTILRVLIRRFNRVPAGIEARLGRLPVQKLESVLDEAVLAADLADFDQRLGLLEDDKA